MDSTVFKWLTRTNDKIRLLRSLSLSLGARLEAVSPDVIDSGGCAKSVESFSSVWLVDKNVLDAEVPLDFFQKKLSFFIDVDSCPSTETPLGWTDANLDEFIQTRLIDFCLGFLNGVYDSYEDIMGWGYHIQSIASLLDLKSLKLPKYYDVDVRNIYKKVHKNSNVDSVTYFSDGVSSAVRFRCKGESFVLKMYRDLSQHSIVIRIPHETWVDLFVVSIESFNNAFGIDFCMPFKKWSNHSLLSKDPHMILTFHGVRGSRPTHKKSLLEYGGNSTSLEFCVAHEDFYLFLDCGSGLAHRGMRIGEQSTKKKFYWLMTHTHWDHILGLPFFEPFYNREHQVRFFASKTSRSTFDELLTGVTRAQNLPVPIQNFQAEMNVQTLLPGEKFKIEDCIDVSTYQINHQGITLAYRVHYKEDSVAVVTDNAPIEDNYLGENMPTVGDPGAKDFEKKFNDGLVSFLKDCHTVVFDTHFIESNLKPDWGHSTPERALEYCIAAGVKRLILFHHAPEDQDSDVFDKVKGVYALAQKHGIEVVAAKEGKQWILR